MESSRRSPQRHLLNTQAVIWLCLFSVICVTSATECQKGKRWWWLSEQRVKINNPRVGGVRTNVTIDQVVRKGGKDEVERTLLRSSFINSRVGYWVSVFYDEKRYMVLENSEFQVVTSERGGKKIKNKMLDGKLQLGTSVVEDGSLSYEYTAIEGDLCKTD